MAYLKFGQVITQGGIGWFTLVNRGLGRLNNLVRQTGR